MSRTAHFVRGAPDPTLVVTTAPIPAEPDKRRGWARTGRTQHVVDVRKCFYSEDEVSRWITCQLQGRTWRPSETTNPKPTLISRREMLKRVPFSYPTVWKLEKTGRFPRPIKIAPVDLWSEPVAAE